MSLKLTKIFLLIIAALTFLPMSVAAQSVQCFPTCDIADGKMLSLAGAGLDTLGSDRLTLRLIVAGVGEGTPFSVGFFDGDSGQPNLNDARDGHWDLQATDSAGNTLGGDELQYRLFADPDGDGIANGAALQEFSSLVMPDNDWFDFFENTSAAAAGLAGSECSESSFCYVVQVVLLDPFSTSESNFKVRSTAQIGLAPQVFSFVGALRTINDANIIYPHFPAPVPTTYDGNWEFRVFVEEPTPFFSIWDGDFDYGNSSGSDSDTDDPDTCQSSDPVCVTNSTNGALVPPWANGTAAVTEGVAVGLGRSTGNPPDDNEGTPLFRRSPNVRYEIETPTGQIFRNMNPSGNQEWEQFRIDSNPAEPADFHVPSVLPRGIYIIRLSGLDPGNFNALRLNFNLIGMPAASIGDRVWFDMDADGIQDPAEPGINDVRVELYLDDGDGVFDPGNGPNRDILMMTQITSGDGDYEFTNQQAGHYWLNVVESTLPQGAGLTTGNEPYESSGKNNPGGVPGPCPLQPGEDHDLADFGYVFPCNECKGGVTQLTLRYLGSSPANIRVETKIGNFNFNNVQPSGEFTIGTQQEKLGSNIEVFVNTTLNAEIHTSCSQPIGPGLVRGDFQVVSGFSDDGGLICPLPVCQECRGGVTRLTLRYTGSAAANIQVFAKKDLVFAGTSIQPGQQFSFSGMEKDGRLGTEIQIQVNGHVATSIHTSCSQPIGPGLSFGDFVVVEAFSRDGGRVCPAPDCLPCEGGVKSLRLRNDGPAGFFRVADNVERFSGFLNTGDVLSISDPKKFGNLEVFFRRTQNDAFQKHTNVHTSCSQPIGPGAVFGFLTVVEGVSVKNNAPICPQEGCEECQGGIRRLTLRNDGPSGVVRVTGKDFGVLFEASVAQNAEFTLFAVGDEDKLPKEIEISVNGVVNTTVHTSCSQPIGPGTVRGSFTVTEAFSVKGGRVCPVQTPPGGGTCGECEGGVTSLTLRNDGPSALFEVFDNGRIFSQTVANGGEFSIVAASGKFGNLEVFVNGQFHTGIHTSCSQPIGPGAVFGFLTVVQSASVKNGPICPMDTCQECQGGVRRLTLRNDGPTATIRVTGKDDEVVFQGSVAQNAEFTLFATGSEGKLPKELTIRVNGVINTTVHTSCSQPIGPGTVRGSFTVTQAYSVKGGLVCPVPTTPGGSCQECKGGVRSLTLRNNGATATFRVTGKNNEVIFNEVVAGGAAFTLTAADKLEKNLTISRGGSVYVTIHTSCSQPIGPGTRFQDLEVVEAISVEGGRVCPVTTPGSGGSGGSDLCVQNADKPSVVVLEYAAADCSATNNSQGEKKTSCTDANGGPAGRSPVRILATDDADATKSKSQRFFEGTVSAGETFEVSAGSSKFKSNTYVHIFSGNTLLQTNQIHTSCSAPLIIGEQFGSLILRGAR